MLALALLEFLGVGRVGLGVILLGHFQKWNLGVPNEALDSLSPWLGSLRVGIGSFQSLQRSAGVKGMTSPHLWELPRSALLSDLASLPPTRAASPLWLRATAGLWSLK